MHEDEGSVSVTVFLISGILARDAIVSLQTLNGTASGKLLNPSQVMLMRYNSHAIHKHELESLNKLAYINTGYAAILLRLKCMIVSFNTAGMDFPNTSLDLTFSPSSTTQTVIVPIFNDAVTEDMLEYFSLFLMSTDPAVSLNPKIANITIVDDSDSKLPSACIYCIMYVPD